MENPKGSTLIAKGSKEELIKETNDFLMRYILPFYYRVEIKTKFDTQHNKWVSFIKYK